MQFKTNCCHWLGDRPCPENRLCEGCQAYQPLGPRILLIKLGARGDVLRTTPLLAGLRKRHPNAHITWLTRPESEEILRGLPDLDRLLGFGLPAFLELQAREFDWLICLDKEPCATGLAEKISAQHKSGWGMAGDGVGTARALDAEAEYSLALGVSDKLKFSQNRKTYMEIIFEACGLAYAGEPYALEVTEHDRRRSQEFFKFHKIAPAAPVLGLVVGCGPHFERKRWTEEGFAALAQRSRRELGALPLLLSGPEEIEIAARIRRRIGGRVLDIRGAYGLRDLAGFLERCRAVVTGDTVALHMSLAMRRPTVALFGPTCEQEIDMFGQGEKVVAPVKCAPCYRTTCTEKPTCMESISADTVWDSLQRVWSRNHAGK